MGLIGFLVTVIVGAAGGWWLKAKVDKPSKSHHTDTNDDEELR